MPDLFLPFKALHLFIIVICIAGKDQCHQPELSLITVGVLICILHNKGEVPPPPNPDKSLSFMLGGMSDILYPTVVCIT